VHPREQSLSGLLLRCISLLLLARNGPDRLVWRCPLIGVDRKWLVEGQNDANDPRRTLARGIMGQLLALSHSLLPHKVLGFRHR
jgi:hypothetical protein